MTSTFTEPFDYLTAADLKPTAYSNFLKHIEVTDEVFEGTPCVRWTGSFNKPGYPKFQAGPVQYAHRFIWLYNFGWLPRGRRFDIAHQCHHRWCVTFEHLELEPRHRNMNDLASQRRDTCVSGRHLKADFGMIDKKNRFVCRGCRDERVRAYYERHPEKKLLATRKYDEKRRAALDAAGLSTRSRGKIFLRQEPEVAPYKHGTERTRGAGDRKKP